MTQLEKFFKNLKASFFASAAIYLVTGMLLMIFPEQIAKVACYLFGGLFVSGLTQTKRRYFLGISIYGDAIFGACAKRFYAKRGGEVFKIRYQI